MRFKLFAIFRTKNQVFNQNRILSNRILMLIKDKYFCSLILYNTSYFLQDLSNFKKIKFLDIGFFLEAYIFHLIPSNFRQNLFI